MRDELWDGYLLVLCREEPEIEEAACYLRKPIHACTLSSVCDLFEEFQRKIYHRLCDEVYEKGMTEEVKRRYILYLIWNCFAKWSSGKKIGSAQILDMFWKEMDDRIYSNNSLLTDKEHSSDCWPIIPDKEFPICVDDIILNYIDVYEREEILKYWNSIEKSEKTLREWFETLSGGYTWVVTCEEDEMDLKEDQMIFRLLKDDGEYLQER